MNRSKVLEETELNLCGHLFYLLTLIYLHKRPGVSPAFQVSTIITLFFSTLLHPKVLHSRWRYPRANLACLANLHSFYYSTPWLIMARAHLFKTLAILFPHKHIPKNTLRLDESMTLTQ